MEKSRTNQDLWKNFERAFIGAGFPVSGSVDLDLVQDEYSKHTERYQSWLLRGMNGDMKYLERGLERRLDPKLVLPEAKSVITVLLPYSTQPVGDEKLRYARYLNGPDYHEDLKVKLDSSIERLRIEGALPENFSYKICIDTSAVLERTWAALTGLGWIGKNTLLIHPQLGSYTFIGVILTNQKFGQGPKFLKDYCGECTRCLKVCPTKALSAHELDARKCISYLTLEKRGPWAEELPVSGYLAGCDLCQEVCPFNTKAVRQNPEKVVSSYLVTDFQSLEMETEEEYRQRIKGTALSRIKFQDFKRNLSKVIPPSIRK